MVWGDGELTRCEYGMSGHFLRFRSDGQTNNPSRQADALMDTSGKINNLGKQYIGADTPQPSTSGNAKVIASSTWAVLFLALTASIGPFASF
jgi:hypothetical protein